MRPPRHAHLVLGIVVVIGPALVIAGPIAAADIPRANPRVRHDVRRWLAERGEPATIWVMFTDKLAASPADDLQATNRLHAAHSARALERRRLRRTAPGLSDQRDWPVSPRHLDAVRRTGARIRVVSRWLNAVSATATADQIEAIDALPFVKRVQLVARGRRVLPITLDPKATLPSEESSSPSPPASPPASPSDLNYGSSYAQLDQINAISLHQAGYTGAGVVLAVLDNGFYKDHEAIDPGRIIAEWDFVNDDGETQNEVGDLGTQHYHGTKVLSIAAGRYDGRIYGPAYEADLILCKTEDMSQEDPVEEDWYVAGLEFAELNGADVVTSSLGYIDWYTPADLDGQTAVTTIAVNIATDNGVICCTAAGNEGTDGLIAPADAFKVITVGAVDSAGTIASFSSRGPTADGRVKPEVVARGVATYYANASGPSDYGNGNGTSFATPLVAGVVTCLVQAHPHWTLDQIRHALFYTADYYVANNTYDPAYARGFGLIDAWAAHQTPFVPGDFDLDFDVDPEDLTHLQTCMTGPDLGPTTVPCRDADLDRDADVDQSDFGIIQRCHSGEGIPGDPACAD